MIDGSIGGLDGIDRLIDRVRDLQEPDMEALAEEVRRAIVAGLTRMAEAGTDSRGRRLAPLASSTVERRHHRDEPLAPGGHHPFLDSLEVEVALVDDDRVALRVLWGHRAARLTAEGTRHQPPRDIFHPDDATMGEVRAIVSRFGLRLLRGT